MGKGIKKGFKNKDLTPKERVKTAVDNFIEASAELRAAAKLGYIRQDLLDGILKDQQVIDRIDSYAMEIYAALSRTEEGKKENSFDQLFEGLS